MADYVEILEGQNNFGWVNTFDLGGKYPAISKRVWKTYDNMMAFANDYSAEGTCISGLILTVYADPEDTKNGVYFVKSVGTSEEGAVVIKIGDIPEGELDSIKAQIEAKQDKIIAGDGINLNEDGKTLSIKIDPSGQGLTVGPDGLKAEVPKVPEYAIAVSETTEGYLKSYELQKDGVPVGVKIDIPKDLVVESGEVKTVESPDDPYSGAQVGDLYLQLVITNQETPIYIPVKSLTDVYTGSTYISVDAGVISVKYDDLKNQLSTDLINPVTERLGTIESGLAAVTATVGTVEGGLVKDVADLKTNLDGKVDKVEGSSLITSEKLALIDTNAGKITALESGKLDKIATVNGQVFVENAVTIDATHINIKDAIGSIEAGTSVEKALSTLNDSITASVAGGLTHVVAGNGVEVTEVLDHSQTISVKKDVKENNVIEISAAGLFVPDMSCYWEDLDV